jgi:hypothetical protein
MSENGNGYKSLWIVFWIFAVIVFPVLFFLGTNVIANENNSIKRDNELRDCIYNYVIPMKESIARIEVKLGTTQRP